MNTSRRNKGNSKKHGPHTLTYDDMNQVVTEQKDSCLLSNVSLSYQPHTKWQCSAERINNDLNYSRENVCAIAQEFQTVNQWSVEKVRHAFTHEDTAFEETFMETMFDETVTVRKAKERLQCEVVDGVMKIRCNYCEVWKDESSFN